MISSATETARPLGTLLHPFHTFIRRQARLLAIPACALGLVSVMAQEALPDLRAMKAGLRKSLLTALMPELKSHRDDLSALEQKQAAAQDFAGAVQSRDARLKLEQQIAALDQELAILAARPALNNAARLAARIEFKLSDAKLNGTQIDATDGAITGWGNADASATWPMPRLPAGGYEVLLRCSGPVGSAILKEGFYSLTAPCKESKDKPVEQNVGTLRIRNEAVSLILNATPPEKCSGWRVYSVVLVPCAD